MLAIIEVVDVSHERVPESLIRDMFFSDLRQFGAAVLETQKNFNRLVQFCNMASQTVAGVLLVAGCETINVPTSVAVPNDEAAPLDVQTQLVKKWNVTVGHKWGACNTMGSGL